jgi:hypothetical protein
VPANLLQALLLDLPSSYRRPAIAAKGKSVYKKYN